MINLDSPFKIGMFYALELAGVTSFFYLLMEETIPMLFKEWIEPIQKFWRDRKKGELEEVDRK